MNNAFWEDLAVVIAIIIVCILYGFAFGAAAYLAWTLLGLVL